MLTTLRESLELLATRRFGTFWFASLLSSIGTWAQQVAEPWLLLTLGASPFLIGLDSFAMDAPAWLLTLAGGALADRADRRRVIAGFQSFQMLCPTAIIVLLLTGQIRPWMVIALSAIVGITDALSMPSFQSIVPSIVAPAEVGHGLALNSTQYNLSRILGPAIAGVLISALGVMSCFAVSAASYIPFVGVALWILPRRHRARADAAAPAEPLEAAGVADILREGHLRGALITVFATALLCSPLMTFIPVLVKDTFQGGAGRFSVMLVAFGSGGLLGAAALLSLPTTINLQRVSSGCALTLGAVLAIVGLNSWIWGLPPLLVLAGASMTISNTSVNSMLQSTVRPHLLGRTVSLYMLALRGGSSLGALITGAMVSQVGVQHALFVNGVVAVGVQAVVGTYWFRADLRRPLRRPA